MDKWDELTSRIQQAILAEEPEAAVASAFAFVAEFGRQVERIADTLEAQTRETSGEPDYPAELEHEEAPELEHDL